MNVYDLIFMACLSLNQGSACKTEMLKCVLEYRDAGLKTYLNATDVKKVTPDQFLNGQPQADWAAWVLDCAKAKEMHITNARLKNATVTPAQAVTSGTNPWVVNSPSEAKK